MHLVFISTLYNPPWGGSEALWSGAAIRALEQGHRVSVFVSEREKLESPLERLKSAGAHLFFWKPKYEPLNFFQRVRKKLSGRKLPQWEWWHGNLPQDADAICVSQGGVFCALKFHGLVEAIVSSQKPYVLLARCDTGIEFFNEETRPQLKSFFENAAAFVAASQSTIDLVKLYLPSKLPNTQVLHSPLADYGEAVSPLNAFSSKNHTDIHERDEGPGAGRLERGEEVDLTTEGTENTEGAAGLGLAVQACVAFSNPSTSELARYSESTSLSRYASGPAGAAELPEENTEHQRDSAESKEKTNAWPMEGTQEAQAAARETAEGSSAEARRAGARESTFRSEAEQKLKADSGNLPATRHQLPATAPEALMACVGRLRVADKGQHLLLACLAEEPWRSRQFRLSLYGEGADRKYLEELVEFYGLGDKVCFAGHTSDVAGIWRRAHLAVQPSFVEGAPQSLLEAMLCRRPCVATAVSGIPEWVEEGKTGFLAEAPTVHHLRLALERAWESRHRWAEMGEAARAACLAKRDPDPAGTLLALLRKAAEREGKAETLKS